MRTDGQAGRHHEASSRFPQFCERLRLKKIGVIYVVTDGVPVVNWFGIKRKANMPPPKLLRFMGTFNIYI
jgi:hypothetical protein